MNLTRRKKGKIFSSYGGQRCLRLRIQLRGFHNLDWVDRWDVAMQKKTNRKRRYHFLSVVPFLKCGTDQGMAAHQTSQSQERMSMSLLFLYFNPQQDTQNSFLWSQKQVVNGAY
ncbi:unnamed protein product [Calypogeia fissa]